MTTPGDLVAAVGGTRLVPSPDPIAAAYLLLGLRLDQHIPGLVDGYFGPADLKARVDTEQLRSPGRLREDVASLADRVTREIDERDRREWMTAQLDALDAHARALAGEPLPYAEYVERCMGFAPRRHDDSVFDDATSAIDAMLPGRGSAADRLEAWDRGLEVPLDRLASVAEWLVERFRERALRDLGLPDGEGVRVSIVRDQPWIAYNWYDGGRRSRVDINIDLRVSAPGLVVTIAHETYPGHHLEHAWKEADLVDGRHLLEVSIFADQHARGPGQRGGLARFGTTLASPLDERVDLLVELFDQAGMAVAADRAAASDIAERAVALAPSRRILDAATDEAAFRRHADGGTRQEVLTYLRDVGRYSEEVATKRLEFIEDPLSRLYVFAYEEGEELIARWVEAVPATERVARFGRLLHEQVTPGRLLAETR